MNQPVQRIQRRKLFVALVGSQHRFERIGSRENDLGKSRAVFLRHLWRKNVFQLVSEFAQLVESAGRRIALKRMHGAPHAANHLLVRGTSLKLQPRFVQRLQQLVRALEEDGAKLRIAIFGSLAQEFASTL